MAKRKTPKTEKVIDLAPKAEKISEQELSKLQATIGTIDKLTIDVGRMEVQKYGLMKAMENMQQNVETIRKEFNDKYGTDVDDVFSVGDELIAFDESGGGNPAKIGKVTKIHSNTSISVDHVEEAFSNNQEICFRGPLTFNFGFEY